MLISTQQFEAAAADARAFSGRESGTLSKAELLAAVDAASRLVRAGQALLAQLAGEVEVRSAPELGMGFAKQQGFGSAPQFIAQVTGGTLTDARRLVEAGGELCGPAVAGLGVGELGVGELADAPLGDVAPLSPLAEALASTAITVNAAALIRETLREVRKESPERDAADLELRLVRAAEHVNLGELRTICQRERAQLNVGAWEQREKRQWEARTASISTDSDGMVVFNARLAPVDAEPLTRFVDAYVGAAFKRGRDTGMPEKRSPGQIRADAIVDLANHELGCDAPVTGVKTTVVVRMGLGELQLGHGLGEADGLAEPISVGTLRAMMADAQVIPAVLGSTSSVLDLGRTTRLFTPAQRIALGERDGGCAWCLAPPSWCDAHHIRWWERDSGSTDMSNGVLLCRSCHMRIHHTGWTVEVRDNVVWFTPPPGDSTPPVVGGKARLLVGAS